MKLFALALLPVSSLLAPSVVRAQCTEEGVFTTSDSNDKYGRGLSAAPTFVAVGAPNDSSISNQEGKVFIYADLSGTWGLQASIQPASLDEVDLFGFSVSAHGVRLAASALFDDDQGTDSGAVYVYRRGDNGWVQEQKLVSPVAEDMLGYGRAVAMSDDLLVVARNVNFSLSEPAEVYVYRRSGTTWSLEDTLTPTLSSDDYGRDVAVSGDVIVVGDPEYGISEGAIEVYRYSSGSGWQPEYFASGSVGSSLGWSVDTYRGHVVAGAWEDDTGVAEVHVYNTGTSSWSLMQTLVGSDSASGDGFGYTVSVASSGIYVGAPGNDSQADAAGAVYAFTLSGGSFTQVSKIAPSSLSAADNFGYTMDATDTLLTGANRFQFTPDARAVYVLSGCP